MKRQNRVRSEPTLLSSSLVVCALLALAVVQQSQAQIVNLTDQNSLAQIDVSTQAGMFRWSVDGTNQLSQQWFWYRVGNAGPEADIRLLGIRHRQGPCCL